MIQIHSVVDAQKQKILTFLDGYKEGFEKSKTTIDNVAKRIGLKHDKVTADDQDATREFSSLEGVPEMRPGPSCTRLHM
jgi:hypothetical protein